MKQFYPRWVPNPSEPNKELLVQTAEKHKEFNRRDYEKVQEEIANPGVVSADTLTAVLAEREACAVLVESWDPKAKGGREKTAAAIRARSIPNSGDVAPQSPPALPETPADTPTIPPAA